MTCCGDCVDDCGDYDVGDDVDSGGDDCGDHVDDDDIVVMVVV